MQLDSLETMETLSPNSPAAPPALLPPTAVSAFLPPPAAPALPRARLPPPLASVGRPPAREKDTSAGMKYEGVIDWLHYSPSPRAEQARFTSVSVGDMYWRIVAPIRTQELVRSDARALLRLARRRRPNAAAPALRPSPRRLRRASCHRPAAPDNPHSPSSLHAAPLSADRLCARPRARASRICSGT